MKEKLIADKYRWNGKKNIRSLPQYKFVYYKRKCEYWKEHNIILWFFYRTIYEHLKIKYMMDIPAKVEIGKGFRIEHIGGIVINPYAKIGENVTILNGVTIGSQIRGKNKGYPNIGNLVWIGSNSIIVGNIKIGDNVLIAPGSFVNFDVPDNSIVIGNPGKIIEKENATIGYIENIYK